MSGQEIFRARDGQFAEVWHAEDIGALQRALDLEPPKTSDAVKLSSCPGDFLGGSGECGGFVVLAADSQAVVEAAKEAAEQVALGGGAPVAVLAAPVVVGAGAG